MTFVDPNTGIVITCSPAEYNELKPQFVKTMWSTYTNKESKDGKS